VIIREKPSAWQLFYIARGSIVPRILPQITIAILVAVLVLLLKKFAGLDFFHIPIVAFSVLGIALSLFLGFRNNTAYQRWWEARCHWGELIYQVRSLGRSTEILLGEQHVERRLLLQESVVFSHFLRGILRGEDCTADAEQFIDLETIQVAKAARNPCDFILRRMGSRVAALKLDTIDTMGVRILDERLAAFSAVQAACERIANTPIPFAYWLLVHRTSYLYCFLLPLGLVGTVGWLTPLFTALLAYVFFGLDAVSEELEAPFKRSPNSLPLDAFCRINEISVAEALSEPAPEPLKAVNYLLN